MATLRPDVVAVATPTRTHAAVIESILAAGSPTAILCEKPLGSDQTAARSIVEAARKRECLVFVNYIRRAEPGALEVKRRLSDGRIGHPVKGVVWYSNGLFNNGSHFLNLLQDWLGEVLGHRLVASGRMSGETDPEPDVMVRFARGEVCFLAAREEHFSHCTVELLAPNGRLRYEQSGQLILWQQAIRDPVYRDYTVLDPVGQTIQTDFARTQWHVADELAAALDGKPARLCSGDEALRTLESLTAIQADI
jgi:predicted dehydrogenase